MRAAQALTADGLFIGQSRQFFELLLDLAEDAAKAANKEKEQCVHAHCSTIHCNQNSSWKTTSPVTAT
jgi:hypothetical protein